MLYRDTAAFVLLRITFPTISPCSLWSKWMDFGLRRAKVLR